MQNVENKNTQKVQNCPNSRVKKILLEIFYRTLPFVLTSIFAILINLFIKEGKIFGIIFTFFAALMFVCPSFKLGYSKKYRKKIIEFHKEQKALPKEKRANYNIKKSFRFERKMIAILLVAYIVIFIWLYPSNIYKIFNYLIH